MKKFACLIILVCVSVTIGAQVSKTEILQDLEKNKSLNQGQPVTATIKSASRLFSMKYDLTSAVMVIPIGSVVTVLDSDSAYYRIIYEESEGYIYKRHAEINTSPVKTQPVVKQQISQEDQPQVKQESRYSYLENKYGTTLAIRLNQGKIWKGMTAEMVRDSWGTPQKINRAINGEIVREEWIYKNSWLFLDNNTLVDWGPVRK